MTEPQPPNLPPVPQERINGKIPRHIAIIMDGNGRWAEKRHLPRNLGHKAGVEAVREIVSASAELGVEVLTLFAFSSENWRRPAKEVGLLMELFLTTLQREVKRLHRNQVRLRLIGEREAFPQRLQQRLAESETLTANNTGLQLVIAANYGGRWDIAQAARRLAERVAAGELDPAAIDSQAVASEISLADLPEPDLFIRTGGEQRISNYLLWQLAYTELYFSPLYWPDFKRPALEEAIASFQGRQRRFGLTGKQVEQLQDA
jgi:undecaprenyl diphosphate synthase